MRILTVEQRKIVLHGYYNVNKKHGQYLLGRYVRRSLSRKEAFNSR
jgi:hypothetical protein